MDSSAQRLTQKYIAARKQHPAWILLSSSRAPLVLACLNSLFEYASDGIAEEDALQALSEMLAAYASQDEYNIDPNNTRLHAGRELREWIKRGLVTERGQRIYATDALATAIHFIESLDNRIMTSTASRLSVVQREIENLDLGLNPNPDSRINAIQNKIKQLEQELEEAKAGHVSVLPEERAIERIREVYSLATGVQAHVNAWRAVSSGDVVWQAFKYRAGADVVSLPVYWRFNSPSQWVSATADAQVQMEYQTLEFLVSRVSDVYQEVLIRERVLWRNKTPEDVVTTAKLADSLSPGVAKGRPLRLLAGFAYAGTRETISSECDVGVNGASTI